MSGLVAETGQLDVCTSITSCGVNNSPYFRFPFFGAVHEVPILVLCRSMHPCHCHINLAGLHQLCSRSLVCLTLLVRHLEGIIERRRGLGFPTPQSVHGVG